MIHKESGVSELISAMAAGWNAQLIVETWSRSSPIATSIGLAVASRHTGARHVCVVPDSQTRLEYTEAMAEAGANIEVMVGDPEEAINDLVEVDFMVVDSQVSGFTTALGAAKLGARGAVLVCKNASSRRGSGFGWRGILDGGSRRLVRSVFLPVGKGLDIAYVSACGGGSSRRKKRWVKHVDRRSGEEIVIRR